MKHSSSIPYNSLPKLPPAADVETKRILRKLAVARAALAEMKGVAEIIPNQAMLINTLTLREAKDSSEIENIVTTSDELYISYASRNKVGNAQIKEVLNYRAALWLGHNLVKETGILTTNIISKIHESMMKNNAGIRTQQGTQLKNSITGQIVYTPPVGEDLLRDLLKNLEEYLNFDEDETDPLIKMAIAHYQFESIHPFYDGNGRIGRIVNILFLVLRGLLDIPILYLSSYIIKEKKDYYRLLSEVRIDINWEDWIYYMLDGVEKTAIETITLIKKIKELLDATAEKIKKELPAIYSKDLVELIFEQPYCKASSIVNQGMYERRTAIKTLRKLVGIGVLKEVPKGNQVLFLNVKLFDLLRMD